MTAVPFIVWWCASAASAAGVHGNASQPATTTSGRFEAGMAGALPTLLVGASLGVSDRVNIGAHYVTHAGLAHSLAVTGRWRAGDRYGLGLTVDESFFAVENLAGIEALRAPLGNRTAATPQALGRWVTEPGVELGGSVGAEVGLLRVRPTPDGAARAFDPALDHLWAEVAASWPRERGALYMRLRAVVPVAVDFHVLGYLPTVTIGRSWGPT